MQIEYLPVYYPSAHEMLDPRAFGRNVREVMASALDIPVVDRRLEDGKEAAAAAAASRDTINIIVEDEDDLEPASREEETTTKNNKFDPKKMGYSYIDFTGNLGHVN